MPRVTNKPSKTIRAIGVTSGVGSMLIGARRAGFEVVGNIEWRKYYHSGTFEANFPGAFMVHSIDEAKYPRPIDLAIGHPECGNFSNLRTTSKNAPDDPGDIPLFAEMIRRITPRYFVMDNLPGSLQAYTIQQWHKDFPDYDLFPEWISNFHYGNTQKNRKRFFLIGAKRSEKYVFVPGEFHHDKTLWDVIKDLPKKDSKQLNHIHAGDDRIIPCGWAAHQLGISRPGNKITLGELKDYIRDWPVGKNFTYLNLRGEEKLRPGYCKIKVHHVSPVLTGGGSALDNHYREDTLNPLTIRERARIQGCPDDFVFLPLDFLRDTKSYAMVYKQTGKFMPVEFCEYVCQQIADHVAQRPTKSTGDRMINHNPFIDEAKQWYCENVGYEDHQKACNACWLSTRCRVRGEPVKPRPVKPVVSNGENRQRVSGEKKRRPAAPRVLVKIPMAIVEVPRREEPLELDVPVVNLAKRKIPDDYHCRCEYCSKPIGELIKKNGEYYSRLERRKYYDASEKGKDKGHIAKTPLHIARWCVQRYTEPKDWVFDPTAGAGTTMVEALVQDRNAAGIELQYTDIIQKNVQRHMSKSRRAILGLGDARDIPQIAAYLQKKKIRFKLVVNNPPYFGDQSFPGPAKEGVGPEFRDKETTYFYDKSLPNLAFLKEGPEYWETMGRIYQACYDLLVPGGYMAIGVKDQMRNRKPDELHRKLADLLSGIGIKFIGSAFLKHHPGTLFLNTYEKIHGVVPVRYQTIVVFQKGK